jgi:hypothetical protein
MSRDSNWSKPAQSCQPKTFRTHVARERWSICAREREKYSQPHKAMNRHRFTASNCRTDPPIYSLCSLGTDNIENTDPLGVTVPFPSNEQLFCLHNFYFEGIYHTIVTCLGFRDE